MRYFAIIDGEQKGPLRPDEMPSAGVTPDTYVWCKEMDDWKQAKEVADICRFYRNRLFELAHPGLAASEPATQEPNVPERDFSNVPLRFRSQIMESSPDDVDLASFGEKPDYSHEPATWWPFPMIFSLLFFFPLGLLAVFQARKSRKAWREGKAEEAHEHARRGKLAAGMSFSLGLIVLAAIIPMLF